MTCADGESSADVTVRNLLMQTFGMADRTILNMAKFALVAARAPADLLQRTSLDANALAGHAVRPSGVGGAQAPVTPSRGRA